VSHAGTKAEPERLRTSIEENGKIEEISLKEFSTKIFSHLRILWQYRGRLGRAFLVGLACGCLVAVLIPARYESSVQLMPPDNQSSSGLAMLATLSAKAGNALGGIAGDALGIKNSGALFIGILRSRTMQGRLVDRFQLKRVYGVTLNEDAEKRLSENTGLSEDRKSGLVTINVEDRNPNRAAAIAQAYVEELNELVAELSTSSAHRERMFLEERLSAVKQDLDDASRKFSLFSSNNKTLDLKEEARAVLAGAAAVEGQLIAAESQLRGLQAVYTDDNIRVQSLQAKVSELRHQLDKMGGTAPGQSKNAGDAVYPSLRTLPLLGVTYADLYRHVQIQESVYETLTQQYELAKVQEVKEIPSVKALDTANIPEKKSFPPRALIAMLGAFLGLATGIVVVLIGSSWDKADKDHPGKALATEIMRTLNGYLPLAISNGSRGHAVAHRVWMRVARRRNAEIDPV
jgi:uncharacterized protein involved in exopolysaccharide biosynthesis